MPIIYTPRSGAMASRPHARTADLRGLGGSRFARTDGVDLMAAADTVVPAILALESDGFIVTQEADVIVARAGNTRFAAEDPGRGSRPDEAHRDTPAMASE